jgi:IPT/TIG domain
MELRSRIPVYARRAALLGALGALLAPATAGAATAHASKKKAKKYPVVTSVRPLETNIGQTLTITGRNFKRGRNKNTVLFKRDGARAVFVKADIGTAKLLKVKLPEKLASALRQVNGSPAMTTFRLRVLSTRLSKSFTTGRRAPRIGPELPPAPPRIEDQSVTNPQGDCDGDGATNGVDSDDDNDLLGDGEEMGMKLDPCKPDTDGDAVEDGYEIRSAQDWNDDEYQAANGYLPYPSKRPYPNALDADADVDHDGDTLTLKQEFALWKYTITQGAPRDLGRLSYSAGEQYSIFSRDASGKRRPSLVANGYDKQVQFLNWANASGYRTVELAEVGANWFAARTPYDIRDMDRSGAVEGTPNGGARAAETTYYDTNNDDRLSDEERDEDADGLSNFDESRGCGNQDYWIKLYDKEAKYYLTYAPSALDDPDSDGDGVRDGADDADHDDLPNVMECSRGMATTLARDPRPTNVDPPPSRLLDRSMGGVVHGFVNPYNPCLPSPTSRSCNQYPALDGAWAPYAENDKYFYIWN